MLRASVGTWVNYGTSLAFQIAFADRFGATSSATAFVIAFSIMAGLSGIVGSTVQTVAVPRLVNKDGLISTPALRFLAVVTLITSIVVIAFELGAPTIAQMLGPRLDSTLLTSLLRLAGLSAVLQLVATELGLIALARGHRLIPAVAPAVPSTIVAAQLVLLPGTSIVTVYATFALGSFLQILLVAVQASRRARRANLALGTVGVVTLAMAASYSLLATIVPIDRLLAGTHHVADSAHYDYALRSLVAVQRLIVGGLMLSALADWSRLHAAGEKERIASSVAISFLVVALVVVLAASIAGVAGRDIVRIVYQRGSFSAADTTAVARILTAALPGFAAESCAMVLTQALASARHNLTLATVGIGHFVIRVSLAIALAEILGGVGVAAAYSITNVILLVALLWLVWRSDLWPRKRALPWRAIGVAIGTSGAAVALAVVATHWPPLVSAVLVFGIFVCLYVVLRPVPMPRLLPR